MSVLSPAPARQVQLGERGWTAVILTRLVLNMAEEKLHKSGLEVDALVLQVVVDQKENLSQGLEEFQFNPAEVCDGEQVLNKSNNNRFLL